MFHCQFNHLPDMTALIIDYFYNHGYCSCKRCIINHKKQIISVKIWSHCIWSWRSSSLTAQTELSSSSDLSSSCSPPWSWWGFGFSITFVNISHLNIYSLPSTRMGQVPKTIWTPSEFVRIWTLSEGTCVQTWLNQGGDDDKSVTGSTEPSCHMFMFVSCKRENHQITSACLSIVFFNSQRSLGLVRALNWYWGHYIGAGLHLANILPGHKEVNNPTATPQNWRKNQRNNVNQPMRKVMLYDAGVFKK